jgi:putative DNA primase/helicase
MGNFPGSHTPGGKVRPLDINQVRSAAFGRWADILQTIGMSAEILARRRNQPCPACGGRDRFQWIDKGMGRFVCRALDTQGGDGFALVEHFLNCDFKTALRAVAGVLGLEDNRTPLPLPCSPRAPLAQRPADPGKRRDKLAAIWGGSEAIHLDNAAGRYLARRGLALSAFPGVLRFHPALEYWASDMHDQPLLIGRYPALLARVSGVDGVAVGLHRIYLTEQGGKARPINPETGVELPCKKLMTCAPIQGAAVQLYSPEGGVIAVAEGIETALAVRVGAGLPCWAAVSAWGLEHIALPEDVKEVYVMADNDQSGTGQRAASTLARRLTADARTARVAIPKHVGHDWLDVLNERQKEEAA